MSKIKKGAGAIITYDKKILMLLRDNKPEIPDPGCWQLIGGDSEKNETPEITLIREVKEETNIQIRKNQASEIGKIIVPGKLEYFLFWVRLSKNDLGNIELGNEGQSLEFLSIDNLEKIKMGKNLSNYFKKYFDGIKKLVGEEILDKKLLGFDEDGAIILCDE
jgi:8-oxo-dGTP diphosphatase